MKDTILIIVALTIGAAMGSYATAGHHSQGAAQKSEAGFSTTLYSESGGIIRQWVSSRAYATQGAAHLRNDDGTWVDVIGFVVVEPVYQSNAAK